MSVSLVSRVVVMVIMIFVVAITVCADTADFKRKVYANEGDIYLKAWPSQKVIRLTTTGYCHDPVISSDGQWVAYIRNPEPDNPDSEPINESELWCVKTDGSKPLRLYRNPLENIDDGPDRRNWFGAIVNPRFSPDGRSVYALVWTHATSSSVLRVGRDGTKPGYIAYGNSLEVIPGGKYQGYLVVHQHLYYKEAGSVDILTLNAPTGKGVCLLRKPEGTLSQKWAVNTSLWPVLKRELEKQLPDTWLASRQAATKPKPTKTNGQSKPNAKTKAKTPQVR